MNILVTGSTGFIGSHLCRRLIDKGHEVFALTHNGNRGGLVSDSSKQLKFIDVDIQHEVSEVIKVITDNRISTIIHMAAKIRGNINSCYQVNTDGTYKLLRIAKKCGVARFLYTSTISFTTCMPSWPISSSRPTKGLT